MSNSRGLLSSDDRSSGLIFTLGYDWITALGMSRSEAKCNFHNAGEKLVIFSPQSKLRKPLL